MQIHLPSPLSHKQYIISTVSYNIKWFIEQKYITWDVLHLFILCISQVSNCQDRFLHAVEEASTSHYIYMNNWRYLFFYLFIHSEISLLSLLYSKKFNHHNKGRYCQVDNKCVPYVWDFWNEICAVITVLITQRITQTLNWGMCLIISLIRCWVCFVWGASEEGSL